MSKRDAAEAFDDNAATPPSSKKRARRKVKHLRSKPQVDGLETTTPGLETSSKTSQAGKAKSEQLKTDSTLRLQNAPGNMTEGSKGPRRKKKGNRGESRPENSQSAGPSLAVIKTEANPKHEARNIRKKNNKKLVDKSRTAKWKQLHSKPAFEVGWDRAIQGGFFIDQDPLMSNDELHLILPTKSHIHVYSTTTSLLVRSLSVDMVKPVTSCIMCPSDPEQILVSTLEGTISKYNWQTGQKMQQWNTQSGLLRIHGLPASDSSDEGHKVLAINKISEAEQHLSHLTLPRSPDIPLEEVVLRNKYRMGPAVVVVDEGRGLVASAGDTLMLGSSASLVSAEYTWREFAVPGRIVSLDARSRPASNKSSENRLAVDLALGLQDGVIVILEDILGRPIRKEKAPTGVDMIFRRLAWHRDAVSSVKWSRDGNYLISGGRETVLVLWQLDTNQQQYLPHLSAPICNIVVSTSGSSYAVRMADNTVMVLSTSDLVPRTNISGPSVARELGRRLRATISPSEPEQLLLATPSDLSPSSQSSPTPSATILQTFDMRTKRQVSRQALTRNVTTVVNVNPQGHRIVDPDVVQIQASYKGQWLATIDEWTPPKADLEPLYGSVDDLASLSRTQTFLKFWSWKEESETWEMTTRVDQPHAARSNSVLALAANPARAQYASAGSDGLVRIWAPIRRLRNGQPIKGSAGEPLYTWKCLYERRPNELSSSPLASQAKSAALAYTEDGSAIAVTFSLSAGGPQMLHFINSVTGQPVDSELHPCPSSDTDMVFSGRYLLFLCDNILVWDVVNFTRVSNLLLKKPFHENHGRFLAANASDGTFALALNPTDFQTPAVVAIFHASQPTQVIHQSKIYGHFKALLSTTNGPGYILVDGEARLIRLSPSDKANESWKLTTTVEDKAMKGLNDIYGGSKITDEVIAPTGNATPRILDGGRSHRVSDGRPRNLEDILDDQRAAPFPLPVSELFEKVAGLFRKDNDRSDDSKQ